MKTSHEKQNDAQKEKINIKQEAALSPPPLPAFHTPPVKPLKSST